jgi:uncharacterized phage-associated protein
MAVTRAIDIAEFFIDFTHKHGDLITNLKLQKLVYYAHAWYIALNKEKLFAEPIEAWVHGPVIPSVYRRFKQYGWNPISFQPDDVNLTPEITDFLHEIMDAYGGYTGYELEKMTHSETPWKNARGNLAPDEASNNIISNDDLISYYSKVGNED